jgi:hypothetical protein
MANNGPYYDEGRYLVEVTDQGFSEAKTGTPQFVLRFKVLGTPDPDGDPQGFEPDSMQYERTFYRAITEKTIPYLTDELAILGFQGTSFRELDKSTPNFHDFTGLRVEMICKHENDREGVLRERWSLSIRGAAPTLEPMEQSKLRKLDTLFGASLKKAAPAKAATSKPAPQRAQTAAPARTAPAATATEVSDDDIPF